MKKNAFTLAEVLITLGIIGVVAALTLPTLIQNHKKTEIVSKLKKASSTISQAHMRATTDFGTSDLSSLDEPLPPNEPERAMQILNTYYAPYLNVASIEKGQYGAFMYLKDGLAFYFRKTRDVPGWAATYLFVCITHKACDEGLAQRETSSTNYYGLANGKDVFTLYTSGSFPQYVLRHNDHSGIVLRCKQQEPEGCTALIIESGWEIPKDYPIKL